MIDDGFRLLPEPASTHAPRVDLLYFCLVGMSLLFTLVIAGTIVYLSIKYRRGNRRVDRAARSEHAMGLEVAWMAIPLGISLGIFGWGAKLFFSARRPPAGATQVRVVAKQWMWKFQHPDGRREINELHVPQHQPVRLTMISEDVIHSFYVPAFRIKQDVLPGSYSDCWFEATRSGEFHLFCAEYCGTNHSRMRGKVVVMEPADYAAWLQGSPANEPPAVAGKRLFESLRCAACHNPETPPVRCPPLVNVFGHDVVLRDNHTVTADEAYLRESILRPGAKIVNGYEPLMPSFDGQVNEEQLIQLIAYIKSLSTP